MKRKFSYLVFLLSMAMLGGCTKQGAFAGSPGAPSKTVILTVWDWHSADPSKGVGRWLTEIDREFERLHPGVKIKHVGQPHTEYYQILKAAAAAASPEQGPDIVMLHQGSRILDQRGSLRP